MSVVDSHCHVSDRWGEPVEVLLAQMDRVGVDKALLVQLLGQHDNSYLEACAARHGDRVASVVGIDAQAGDALAALERCADAGARGLRLRPGARSPGDDPLAVWRAAARLGLVVSCVGNTAAFCDPAFAALIQTVPQLPIVLEHLGGTSTADADDSARRARIAVFALARHPNVHVKLPGIGELVPRAPDWPARELPFDMSAVTTVAAALEAFGARRVLWGSDFPVVSAREGYALALEGARRALAGLPAADRAAVFGGNAVRLFKLNSQAAPKAAHNTAAALPGDAR